MLHARQATCRALLLLLSGILLLSGPAWAVEPLRIGLTPTFLNERHALMADWSAYLERKRLHKPENDKETARIMSRMVGAGFSTGTIRKVLSTWKVDDESLLALDALEEEIEDS